MPWYTSKDRRKADGSPIHFFGEVPTKESLPSPSGLAVVPGTERRIDYELKQQISAVDWIKREIALVMGVPDDPVVKKITENVKKALSDDPIDRIEGSLYLRKNYPEIPRDLKNEYPYTNAYL